MNYNELRYVTVAGLRMVHTPLYVGVEYSPEHTRRAIEAKKAALAEALRLKEYSTVVYLHERAYRIHALVKHFHDIKDAQTRMTLLGSVWTDCEAPHTNLDVWRTLFMDRNIKLSMTDEERERYDALPKRVKVYRGVKLEHVGKDKGLSWTLDRKRAEWFANRYGGEGRVFDVFASKSIIRALYLGRGEDEVVCVFK